MILSDRVTTEGSTRRTPDGFLAAKARIARTGIQTYTGAEVGKPELGTVKVYRPPEEVFSDATLRSFAHRPLTLEHPDTMVNAANWKDTAVGHTGGTVHRDGDYIVVDLALMDQDAITAFEGGKRELSCGYSCELDFTSGATPSGEAFDAIQRGIRNNHVALVGVARGGSALRIGDGNAEAIRAQARRDHEEWKRQQQPAPTPIQQTFSNDTASRNNAAFDSYYSQVLAEKAQVQSTLNTHDSILLGHALTRKQGGDNGYSAMVDSLDYRSRG